MPTQLNQCKKHEYQKLVSKHKQQTQAANNELFLQAQKIVINFCEQWGTDFYTHQGDFFLDFGHPYHRAIKEKKFGEYHIYSLGDARYLLQFIAPDLLDLLQTNMLGAPLGSWLDPYKCKSRWDWQVITTNSACDAEPQPLEVKAFKNNLQISTKPSEWILGPVSKPLCDVLVKAYQDEFDRCSDYLTCLNEYSFVYPSGMLQ